TIVEGTEDFAVAIAAPSVGTLGVSRVDTVIADNDASSVTWSIAGSTQVNEGDTASYTVSYTGASLAPGITATVVLGSTDGTADAGSDYTALATTLTFTGGGATARTVAVS